MRTVTERLGTGYYQGSNGLTVGKNQETGL